MPLSLTLVTGPVAEPVSLALAKSQCRIDSGPSPDDVLIETYITAARQWVEKYTGRCIFNQTWKRTLDHFPLWWSADGTVNPNYRNDWPYYSDFWNRITIDVPFPRTVAVQSITYTDQFGVQKTMQGPVTYTDLAISADNALQVTSAANPFTWQSVNATLNITGGEGFTPGHYRVESVAAGVATLSRAAGTQGSAAGAGNLSSTYVVDITSTPARIVPALGTYWPSEMTYIPGSVAITFVAGSYGDGVEINTCPKTISMAILLLVSHWYEHRVASENPLASIPFGVEALLDTEVITTSVFRPL